MSYHFLCPNTVPLILHIHNIWKYFNLIKSILCVLEIGKTQEFVFGNAGIIQYSTKSMAVFFFSNKKTYYDRYYDILHRYIIYKNNDNLLS